MAARVSARVLEVRGASKAESLLHEAMSKVIRRGELTKMSAIGNVMRNWPHVFSILNLFGEVIERQSAMSRAIY